MCAWWKKEKIFQKGLNEKRNLSRLSGPTMRQQEKKSKTKSGKVKLSVSGTAGGRGGHTERTQSKKRETLTERRGGEWGPEEDKERRIKEQRES